MSVGSVRGTLWFYEDAHWDPDHCCITTEMKTNALAATNKTNT